MITDAVIRFFTAILQKIVDLFPEAPVMAVGNGATAGVACCATFMISSISALVNSGSIRDYNGNTGMAALARATPIPVLIDFYWLGFVVGCLMAIALAFFIVRILLLLWQQVKW